MDEKRKFRTMCFKFRNSQELREEILAGALAFLGLVSEKQWYENQSYPREGKWQATVGQMVDRFEESGHPVFKSVSPLARGILRRKNNKETIHVNADASNTALKLNDSFSKSAQYLRSSRRLEERVRSEA